MTNINLVQPKHVHYYDSLYEAMFITHTSRTYAIVTIKRGYTHQYYWVNKVKPVVRYQEN